ncbi:MAG: lysoplasmalogenase [Bernardetiaceae bacterium]|nr:lysoplasmalogenase [Bernardetiaceae bacterium]
MNATQKNIFYAVFLTIWITNLIGRIIDEQILDFISKPLLMPALLFYFWKVSSHPLSPYRKWIFVGLIFSWLGDIVLMFNEWFIAGLGLFLITHLAYIYAFYEDMQIKRRTPWRKHFTGILPFVLTWAAVIYFLFPRLDTWLLQIAVPFYAATILTMAYLALDRASNTIGKNPLYVYYGASLFAVSDGILAFNQFDTNMEIPLAGLWVMLTYVAAQAFIVRGSAA